jgi:2-hydroxychromene-2-carboxylate isomerase
VQLIIYGSFNCPYSYLASLRADRLMSSGAATVEWRAVVHDPDVPAEGVKVEGELAEKLDGELEEINGLLIPGESYPACRPGVEPNTTDAVAGYAGAAGEQADRLRRALFSAYWSEGEDIGDREVLDRLGCPAAAPGERMRRWESEWRGMERPIAPTMVLPDGKVSRGLGALRRLADMEGGGPVAP